MKKIVSFLISCFILSNSFAQIKLVVDKATFLNVGDKPYVEFYLSVDGNSISYAETETDQFQGKLQVTYFIEQDTNVVAFKKFELLSPSYKIEDFKADILDLKRIPLENGDYSYSFEVVDLTSGVTQGSENYPLNINLPANSISISEVQLLNNIVASTEQNAFVKNGFDLSPNVAHTFGLNQNKLSFYAEIYNANKSLADGEDYLIDYKIVDESGKVSANLRGIKRATAGPVQAVIQTFQLEDLPSGNYSLTIEARNKKNELIAKSSTSFLRSNPNFVNYSAVNASNTFVDSITNQKELEEYIKALSPISSDNERLFAENQLAYADLKLMQKFFLNFWKTRNNEDPEREWLDYKEQLRITNKEFGYGNIKGYQTERGRVYLQYGAPNAIQDMPYEQDTYPYSVWQYYKLDGMVDRKFIFYSPSMEMLGYQILHSNVRGEIYNPNWELELVSKTQGGINNTFETPQGTIVNDRANDLFTNPR